MKPSPVNLAANLFKRTKTPGFNETCTLINLDDEPAALVDCETATLLFINSRLIKLCSFTTGDLWEKPAELLFSQLNLKAVNSGEIRTLMLNRRDQPAVRVNAKFDYLDHEARWLRIRLISKPMPGGQGATLFDPFMQYFLQVNQLYELTDLKEALAQFVGITRELLQTEAVVIYQADPAFPQLQKTAGSESNIIFPDSLPSSDIFRLNEPSTWKAGSRVLTDIHRFSRLNNFNYLMTVPLKQGSGTLGLLVCGGVDAQTLESSIDLLEVSAAMVAGMIQHFLLVENLQQQVTRAQKGNRMRSATVEAIQEGVIFLDPELKIEEINPAAEWMLGYASWEVKGQSYENILIGTDRILPAIEDARRGNSTHNLGSVSLNRRSGQSFPCQIQVTPVLEGDTVVGIGVILADLSEQEQSKAVTQQLEHRAVLGDYTAAFAHDVRNPINSIYTGIQLLGARLKSDDPNQEVIGRIQNDCTRLNHLMESFLAFSRPIEPRVEDIEVGIFLQRIIDRWRPKFAKVNVTPVLHVDDPIEKMRGDSRSLDQVFTNLISNALDAMSASGDTLAIRAVMNREISGHPQVEITVSDNGPGIPEDLREHIFEPFVTTRKQGTGLGLAITKQIVTAHKGSISVDSFPGGTVFTVRIPASIGEE